MREALAQATRKTVRASGGRPVRLENLHVTLAFLGSVRESRLPELAQIAQKAAQLAGPGGTSSPHQLLELTLEHLEHWRPAQLLCAVPAERPTSAIALARSLQDLLAEPAFAADLEGSRSGGVDITQPFRPHVTLARRVYRSPRTIEMQPITWGFTDFALVDSRTLPEGAVYTVLEKFPLEL